MSKLPTKKTKLELLQKQEEVKKKIHEMKLGLPHLYERPWYQWAWDFFQTRNKMALLCAANQISKSSTMIRLAIEWAGNPKAWPELWPNHTPRLFWYFYPDQATVNQEVKEKWEPEFLPRYGYKEHATYGWEFIKDGKDISGIKFNSGVSIFFKTHTQKISNLQSGTVAAVFCFPADTAILTPRGALAIQDLRVGDEVLTPSGVERVSHVMQRESLVIKRDFSNGSVIEATPDHPFWTSNRGWVRFADLTPADQCGTVPAWKLIKKLFYSKRNSTCESATSSITDASISADVAAIFTSQSGKRITRDASQRITSSIIETKIRSTIGSRISNALRALNIHGFTRSWSGKSGATGNSTVNGAESISNRAARSVHSRVSAARIAAALANGVNASVVKLLSKLVSRLQPVSVLSHAPISERYAQVYNLTVDGSHTFIADGIFTHNCDEELPVHFYPELNARLIASNGYYRMVFTATLNQDMWKRAIEGKGDAELFPNAWKMQVSMFDCLTYRDGTPSTWTEERILEILDSCSTENERQRRVHGKFVAAQGLKYGNFDSSRHYIKPFEIPNNWHRYCGIDHGSGGENHKPAISFIAVRPDFRYGVVYRHWRGDDGSTYTAGDTLNKFLDLRKGQNFVSQRADPRATDFITLANRNGEPFVGADSSHTLGEDVINTLFKNDMLHLFDEPEEMPKLGGELSSLMKETPKNRAKDDSCDSLRYGSVTIPWDWTYLKGELSDSEKKKNAKEKQQSKTPEELEIEARRGEEFKKEPEGWDELAEEFDEFNLLAGT